MRYERYSKLEKVRLTCVGIAGWQKEREYSASIPSGVTPGKRWLRHDGGHDPSCDDPGWLLCSFSEETIGEDGIGRCSIIRQRAIIRVFALTDRMVVVDGADVDRTLSAFMTKTGERTGIRFTADVRDFFMDTFGYEPERITKGNYHPLHAERRNRPIFIFKFKNAADALVFKMWLA